MSTVLQDDNMKKYSLIYMISFVMYPFLYVALPYATAKAWADITVLIFIAAAVYQLLYMIFLRKKDDVSLKRSIARYFLYLFITSAIPLVWFYADIFFNGYTFTFLNASDGPYYGFEAWSAAVWENIIYLPLLAIFTAYITTYCIVSHRLKNKS